MPIYCQFSYYITLLVLLVQWLLPVIDSSVVEKIIVSVWSVKPVYYSCCINKAGKLCYNVILFTYKHIFTIKMWSVWGEGVCMGRRWTQYVRSYIGEMKSRYKMISRPVSDISSHVSELLVVRHLWSIPYERL